jgi:pteridine reductase
MELSGRVALVTGAAKRVGRAIALRLAECGMHVAAHYRTSDSDADTLVETCRGAAGRAAGFQADLSDAAETAGLIARVMNEFGRLDVLVNNAATFDAMKLDDFDPDAWERTLRVNLTAPMILAHAARDELRRRGGRIINICDVATQRPWPSHLSYIVSKGGLDTLTRALARAFAPEVLVAGIAPGVAEWPEEYDAETRERLTRRIPLGRAGSPRDIANAVQFLLQSGDYVTGAIIPVDGGRHIV